MSYRNRTYVIFDGDNDIRSYHLMKAWRERDNIDFDFYDAHDIHTLTHNASNEVYIKSVLRERLKSTKQVIVLVGNNTWALRKYVPWEIENAIDLGLPIIVVNLNGHRQHDPSRCPSVLDSHFAVHISFNAAIIKHALDSFPSYFATNKATSKGPHVFNDSIYKGLGL